MDGQVEKAEAATELAFAHLRNAVANHDQDAVASISYRLLARGHKFEVILDEAVSAVDGSPDKPNDTVENKPADRRQGRYAYLVVAGLSVMLPRSATDLAPRTPTASEAKPAGDIAPLAVADTPALAAGDQTPAHAEWLKWAQHVTAKRVQASGDKTPAPDATEKVAVAVPLRNDEPRSADQAVPPPDPGAAPKEPTVHPRSETEAPIPLALLVPVQANSSPPQRPSKATPVDVAPYVSRGDQLFAHGDVTGARLLYQRAAEYGDATAAERLGNTYDPKILAQNGLPGLVANEESALYWYKRAEELRGGQR